MKDLIYLGTLSYIVLSAVAHAKPTLISELGTYDQTKYSIENSLMSQGIDYVSLSDSFNETNYKINFRNQYQIKNWFSYDWHELQKNYDFDLNTYLDFYSASSMNDAKKSYYSSLEFSAKKMFHNEELRFFKEWGGLNHPPLHNENKIQNLTKYAPHFTALDYDKIDSPYFDVEFNEKIDTITDSELSFKNKLEILEDNEAYLKKLELIKRAQTSIMMSSLVYVCDSSTKALTLELVKKAKQGVEVYILYDKLISKLLWHSECPSMMKDAGIHIIAADDAFKYEGNAIYHSKKLIVDFKEAIVGGHNMLNADNISKGTDFKNRDLDLLVKGPLVTDIAKGFIADYDHFYQKRLKILKLRSIRVTGKNQSQRRMARLQLNKWMPHNIEREKETLASLIAKEKQKNLRGKNQYKNILENKDSRMDGVCRFINQAPHKDRTSIGKAYLEYLELTENYLGIMTPELLDTKYMSFSERPLIEKFDEFGMYNKLHDKIMDMGNQEGIKIDLLTSGPEVAGNEAVAILHEQIRENIEDNYHRTANTKMKLVNFWNNYYGKPHYKNLIEDYVPLKNVDIWTHISFTHSKVFYFDRVAVSIGSYNLHHNATDHAYENTIICMDKELNNEMDEVFVRDMANSIPLIYKELVP